MSWRIWSEQITFLSLHHKNPPSLFTMLKSAGRFFIYEIHQAILITSWAFNYTEKPRIRLFWNDECRQILRSIGYYRLSGYLYPFLEIPKTNHIYKRGSTLNGALSLYEFDREFCLLVFNQIERIEIAVRSAITNILCAETNDVFWISSPSYFANTEKFNRTKALIDKELQTSREDFISHFKRTYDEPYPPSWMLAEIIPLGTLTRVYENIASNQLRKKIAKYFGLSVPVFVSWMTIITLTRNSCCHHARLWNRSLSLRALTMTRPMRPWLTGEVQQGRVFFTLCILKHFRYYPPRQWF